MSFGRQDQGRYFAGEVEKREQESPAALTPSVRDLRSRPRSNGYVPQTGQAPNARHSKIQLLASKIPSLKVTLLLLSTLLLASCQPEEIAPLKTTYYHWQTELAPDSTARQLMRGTDRLFVKAFDVIWADGGPAPTAELQLIDTTGLPQLTPVVFITNEVLLRLPGDQLAGLASQISVLTERLLPAGYDELQIDCDWTALTRVQYFGLLKAIKRANPNRQLSCTIRLHQYRDRAEQGTPPVDRGTLMAYNTGDLADWETENSIVDTTIILAYLQGQAPYPIPLDIAVAVYDWAAVYRRGELALLLNEPDLAGLADTSRFTRLSPTRYRADTATYLNEQLLYAGDLIRHEVAPPGRVAGEAAFIRSFVGSSPEQRLLIYRVGSRLWEAY